MDRIKFWDIIAIANITNPSTIETGIMNILNQVEQLSRNDLIKFKRYYDNYKTLANKSLIIGVIALNCGDKDYSDTINSANSLLDIFLLFGFDRYIKTLANPDSFSEITIFDFNSERFNIKAFNCTINYMISQNEPHKKFISLNNNLNFSEIEKTDITGGIKYSNDINFKWSTVDELKNILPNTFNIIIDKKR